jgi:hypothetical protein
MDETAVKILNEWITDAVNLSVQDSYQWVVTSPSLDMGWTSGCHLMAIKTVSEKRYAEKSQEKQWRGKIFLKTPTILQ